MKSFSLSRSSGFSLVEVTLSIGIVAFAFIGLLGLLPVGLQTFRAAIDTTVQSQIVQQIVTRAQQTEFANLDSLASKDAAAPIYYYFSDEAVELSTAKKRNSNYTAAVSRDVTTNLPAGSSTNTLATLRINIYNNKGIFDGTGAPVPPTSVRYTIHLADFGLRL